MTSTEDSGTKVSIDLNKWQFWCRLCGRIDSQHHVDIFRDVQYVAASEQEISLIQAIEKFLAVQISQKDNFSKRVCPYCIDQIKNLIGYHERVHRVQQMFEMIRKSAIETQNLEQLRSKFGISEEESTSTISWKLLLKVEENKPKDMSANDEKLKVEDVPAEDSGHLEYDKESLSSHTLTNEDPLSSISESQSCEMPASKNRRKKTKTNVQQIRCKLRNNKERVDYGAECVKLNIICSKCQQKFDSFEPYRSHLVEKHNKVEKTKKWECPTCAKILTSSCRLERHLRSHIPRDEPDVLPCPDCGKKFLNNSRLRAHIQYKHNLERFVCEECGAFITTKANLKFHMLTHRDYAPFECEVCKKRFKHARRLKIHMDTHDNRKHVCNICGLQLNTRITLRSHMSVHNDVMKYKCEFCGRGFKLMKTLKFHLISHTGLKPYTCDFCDRAFTNNANCRLHKMKIHPDEWAALEKSGDPKKMHRLPNMETLKALAASGSTVVETKEGGKGKMTTKLQESK